MRVKSCMIVCGAVFAVCVLATTPAAAQKIAIGGDPGGQWFTGTNEVPAFVVDVDDAEAIAEEIVIGRADTAGALDADVDLEIIDPFSTLSSLDTAFYFNSSTADLTIGSGSAAQPGDDGDVFIQDGQGATTISMFGSSGNITQVVDSASPINGNGLVKGWATINAAGNIISCYNCLASGTQNLFTGIYEVDFAFDISGRPRLGVIDTQTNTVPTARSIGLADRGGDVSSVWVEIRDATGSALNHPFTVFVF